VTVREPHSLGGQTIHVGRGDLPSLRIVVPDIPIAEIIGQDNEDIGPWGARSVHTILNGSKGARDQQENGCYRRPGIADCSCDSSHHGCILHFFQIPPNRDHPDIWRIRPGYASSVSPAFSVILNDWTPETMVAVFLSRGAATMISHEYEGFQPSCLSPLSACATDCLRGAQAALAAKNLICVRVPVRYDCIGGAIWLGTGKSYGHEVSAGQDVTAVDR